MTDIIKPRKLNEIKSIVAEHDLEVKGDNKLLDLERVEHFPQHQIDLWVKELGDLYSHLPKDLINHIVDLYNTNPTIFDEVCEDAKNNPDKYKAKPQEPLRFPEGSDTVEIKNSVAVE